MQGASIARPNPKKSFRKKNARPNNRTDLAILEPILIKQHNPVVNKKVKDFSRTLKIF